jgi:hypothetical protein
MKGTSYHLKAAAANSSSQLASQKKVSATRAIGCWKLSANAHVVNVNIPSATTQLFTFIGKDARTRPGIAR